MFSFLKQHQKTILIILAIVVVGAAALYFRGNIGSFKMLKGDVKGYPMPSFGEPPKLPLQDIPIITPEGGVKLHPLPQVEDNNNNNTLKPQCINPPCPTEGDTDAYIPIVLPKFTD